MTWALGGAGTGADDRAAAAGRALGRAQEAVGGAVRHLVRAADVDWTGVGAAGYRDDLATALAGVRLLHTRLGQAHAAAAEHAAVVREQEALVAATGSAAALAPPGRPVPALDVARRWGTPP